MLEKIKFVSSLYEGIRSHFHRPSNLLSGVLWLLSRMVVFCIELPIAAICACSFCFGALT